MLEEQRKAARILVVDDEPQNVRYVSDVLDWAGYERVEGLTDPTEAVARFPDFQPDLVVLDLLMPGMDGFSVMEAMREGLDDDEYLPFLILTSDISSESRRRALSSGAKDFLNKPMSPTEVRLRVDNLLETRLLYLECQRQASELGRSAAVPAPAPASPDSEPEIIERWGESLEIAVGAPEGRARRVAWLAARTAESLDLAGETVERIRLAATLHLLGSRLHEDSAAAGGHRRVGLAYHPQEGARILTGTHVPALETARRALESVEEHWDGSGEPKGLRGDAIPIEARILAAAMYFDDRWEDAHGQGRPPHDAAAIEALVGTRFDPAVVAAIVRVQAVGAQA